MNLSSIKFNTNSLSINNGKRDREPKKNGRDREDDDRERDSNREGGL